MKIRCGFVSNSSSASFVASAASSDAKITITVKHEYDLAELADYTIETIDELDAHFTLRACRLPGKPSMDEMLEMDGVLKSTYDAAKKAIEDGRAVFVGLVSNYGGGPIQTAIYYGRDINAISAMDINSNGEIESVDDGGFQLLTTRI